MPANPKYGYNPNEVEHQILTNDIAFVQYRQSQMKQLHILEKEHASLLKLQKKALDNGGGSDSTGLANPHE